MSKHYAFALGFFVLGVGCAFVVTMLLTMMIGEINRKKADSETISYIGFHLLKMLTILSEYKRLYPKGRLRVQLAGALVIQVIAFVGLITFLYLGRPLN